MKVKVKCPASCGELIQGIIGDGEKLISLPIDRYSEVTLEETKKGKIKIDNNKKSILALRKTFEYFNVPDQYMENVSLQISSDIPVAKGMASSTADIAATITAAVKLLGQELNPDILGELCCKIEPTDSTIFHRLTLFDHIKGKIIEKHDWNLRMKVLILEMDSIVRTEEFRKKDYSKIRYENKKEIERAYEKFSLACKRKDKKLLGEAVTISSLANQKILFKPKLNEVIDLSNRLGAYGVNVAHSGTVVGILYDEKYLDVERLRHILLKERITEYYVKMYIVNVIKGGVRTMGEEGEVLWKVI